MMRENKQLHARKPCVALSGKAPAGKREDRSIAAWPRGSLRKHDNTHHQDNSRKQPQQAMSSPVLLLWGSLVGKKKLATVLGRAGEPCPDVLLCSSCSSPFGPVLLTFFCCLLVVLLQVFIGRGCRPISGCPPPFVVLPFSLVLSSSPLLLLFLCSPHLVLLSLWFRPFFVLLMCSCCFPSLILLSPVVLLWSFRCTAAVVLFVWLSEAGAGAAAAHHHSNNFWRLLLVVWGCLGSVLVYIVYFLYVVKPPNMVNILPGSANKQKLTTPPKKINTHTNETVFC